MEADPKKRSEYLEKVEEIPKENRVYIDESGINKDIIQERAWSKRGKPVQAKKSGKYYLRTNIISGLVENKSITPLIFYGTCNTEVFNCWVEEVLIKELKPGQTVILDNVSFHKSPRTKELIESVGCKILFLPPYSPDLNPIEKFWANMKRWVKSQMTEASSLFDTICGFFRKSLIQVN